MGPSGDLTWNNPIVKLHMCQTFQVQQKIKETA